MWILPLLFAAANAASLTSYFDADCKTPLINTVAFTDVCTWSSNRFSGSYALYLTECSSTSVEVSLFNLTGQAGCQGTPDFTFAANASCTPYKDAFVKVNDFTCNSQNTTYNILAHFTPECQDGGYAFSMNLGQPECLEASFGPGLWNWDAEGSFADPYYQLAIFNTTDGTCQDELAVFQTKSFPAECLAPTQPFQTISIDIYPAFPLP
jgi:hypothetical protein